MFHPESPFTTEVRVQCHAVGFVVDRVTLRQGFLRAVILSYSCGLGCTVGTATRYGFDTPKFEARSA